MIQSFISLQRFHITLLPIRYACTCTYNIWYYAVINSQLSSVAEELTTVPSEEPTTSSTEATPPVESTESTGATEDLMPGGNDAVTQTTASISEEYQTLENMTEIQIERTISDVEKDINTTQDAVNLLQGVLSLCMYCVRS